MSIERCSNTFFYLLISIPVGSGSQSGIGALKKIIIFCRIRDNSDVGISIGTPLVFLHPSLMFSSRQNLIKVSLQAELTSVVFNSVKTLFKKQWVEKNRLN